MQTNSNFLFHVHDWFAKITTQKPKIILSKRHNADFKLRKGMEVGLKVDLRGNRMFNFYNKLIYISCVKITNFSGF